MALEIISNIKRYFNNDHKFNSASGRTMPGRSKTLGPDFMRGAGSSRKVDNGYVSSPDNGGPDINSIRLTSRFSAVPETNYHGRYPIIF